MIYKNRWTSTSINAASKSACITIDSWAECCQFLNFTLGWMMFSFLTIRLGHDYVEDRVCVTISLMFLKVF
jgi:hypothetical protein